MAVPPWLTTASQEGSSSDWGMKRSTWMWSGWGPNCSGSLSGPTVRMAVTGSLRSPSSTAANTSTGPGR